MHPAHSQQVVRWFVAAGGAGAVGPTGDLRDCGAGGHNEGNVGDDGDGSDSGRLRVCRIKNGFAMRRAEVPSCMLSHAHTHKIGPFLASVLPGPWLPSAPQATAMPHRFSSLQSIWWQPAAKHLVVAACLQVHHWGQPLWVHALVHTGSVIITEIIFSIILKTREIILCKFAGT